MFALDFALVSGPLSFKHGNGLADGFFKGLPGAARHQVVAWDVDDEFDNFILHLTGLFQLEDDFCLNRVFSESPLQAVHLLFYVIYEFGVCVEVY